MKKISILDRILLVGTVLLSAYQIVIGVDGGASLAVIGYTVAFGVLLVASLLIIIMGFDVLDSPLVVILSTLIPLGISLGLVVDYFPQYTTFYLAFAVVGFLAVAVTRYLSPRPSGIITLIIVHGISGLLIFLLPLYLVAMGIAPTGFILVSIGGGLIGLAGLLLSFLKAGKPILEREAILSVLPILLLLTTLSFVAGFAAQ